jgi:rare lipoprotein A
MKSTVAAAALVLAGMAAIPSQSLAQDWVETTIAEARRQRGETTAAANPRAAPASRSAVSEDDGSRPQRRAAPAPRSEGSLSGGGETGVASYYWQPQRVASGGWFNPDAWTAAHKSLPFGTRVRVTRLDNGNSVQVTINDRGPYVAGRIIDLSRRAAQAIGMTGQGLARVRVERL